VYVALRRPVNVALRRRWEIHVYGEDHVPRSGPVILAPNHTGFIDGPLLSVVGPRRVFSLAKQEVFTGGFGLLARLCGQISVDRRQPDPGSFRRLVARLLAGDAVAVFPEGTRGAGEFERLKAGAAYLALVTGAPVVPVAFFGTRLPGAPNHSVPPPGSRFDVVYGSAVYFDQQPWPRRRDLVENAHERLAGHLRQHLHEAQALTGGTFPGPLPDPEED
jgi:1-acyl-sn-glycerol-3-phosphate acyltransferase